MAFDSEFLMMLQTEKVRDTEREAWINFREILADVAYSGTSAIMETSADFADGFLNPPSLLAGCFL